MAQPLCRGHSWAWKRSAKGSGLIRDQRWRRGWRRRDRWLSSTGDANHSYHWWDLALSEGCVQMLDMVCHNGTTFIDYLKLYAKLPILRISATFLFLPCVIYLPNPTTCSKAEARQGALSLRYSLWFADIITKERWVREGTNLKDLNLRWSVNSKRWRKRGLLSYLIGCLGIPCLINLVLHLSFSFSNSYTPNTKSQSRSSRFDKLKGKQVLQQEGYQNATPGLGARIYPNMRLDTTWNIFMLSTWS